MKNYNLLLRWSLLGGSIYFFLIAAAHLLQIKIPLLFIYFNVPSYHYQDLIISFLAFGWGMFLFSGYASAKRNELINVKYIIFAGFGAIAGLTIINTFIDFNEFMLKFEQLELNIKVSYFWLETLFILAYLVWLLILYLKAGKIIPPPQKQSETNIYNREQEMYARKWR